MANSKNRSSSLLACLGMLAAASMLLAGCGRGDSPASSAAAQGTPAQPPAVPVHVQVMAPQRVPIDFDVVAQTEGSKQVEVRARVSGILEKQLYKEGDPVRAGAPLFQIDPATYRIALDQARAALNQEKARGSQAKREAERLQPLVQDRAISRKEYDDAASTQELSLASQQQAAAKVREAELNLSWTRVTAPVGGITGRAEHSEGSLVTTDANGSLLTTINQVTPMWVRFSLAQSDLARLPGGKIVPGSPMDISLRLPDGSKYPVKGRLNFAATEIDPKLGTQALRAEFDNTGRALVPGQFVRVQLIAGQLDNVYLVPQIAVVQTEQGYFVFVVDGEGKAAFRPVKTGTWIGANWAILSGLNSGDQVIVDNLLKVRPGIAVAVQQAAAPTAAAAPADGAAGPAAPAPQASRDAAPGQAPAGGGAAAGPATAPAAVAPQASAGAAPATAARSGNQTATR